MFKDDRMISILSGIVLMLAIGTLIQQQEVVSEYLGGESEPETVALRPDRVEVSPDTLTRIDVLANDIGIGERAQMGLEVLSQPSCGRVFVQGGALQFLAEIDCERIQTFEYTVAGVEGAEPVGVTVTVRGATGVRNAPEPTAGTGVAGLAPATETTAPAPAPALPRAAAAPTTAPAIPRIVLPTPTAPDSGGQGGTAVASAPRPSAPTTAAPAAPGRIASPTAPGAGRSPSGFGAPASPSAPSTAGSGLALGGSDAPTPRGLAGPSAPTAPGGLAGLTPPSSPSLSGINLPPAAAALPGAGSLGAPSAPSAPGGGFGSTAVASAPSLPGASAPSLPGASAPSRPAAPGTGSGGGTARPSSPAAPAASAPASPGAPALAGAQPPVPSAIAGVLSAPQPAAPSISGIGAVAQSPGGPGIGAPPRDVAPSTFGAPASTPTIALARVEVPSQAVAPTNTSSSALNLSGPSSVGADSADVGVGLSGGDAVAFAEPSAGLGDIINMRDMMNALPRLDTSGPDVLAAPTAPGDEDIRVGALTPGSDVLSTDPAFGGAEVARPEDDGEAPDSFEVVSLPSQDLACVVPPSVTLDVRPAAETELGITSPCHADSVATVSYHGMTFGVAIDRSGRGAISM
ncbi:MAG: hypothetical protein AAFV86_10895, partial [Pseudomonadota bacterium]